MRMDEDTLTEITLTADDSCSGDATLPADETLSADTVLTDYLVIKNWTNRLGV